MKATTIALIVLSISHSAIGSALLPKRDGQTTAIYDAYSGQGMNSKGCDGTRLGQTSDSQGNTDPLACVPAQGSICVLLADAIAGDGLCQILVFDDADCTGAGQAFQFNAVGDSANAAFNSFKADCS